MLPNQPASRALSRDSEACEQFRLLGDDDGPLLKCRVHLKLMIARRHARVLIDDPRVAPIALAGLQEGSWRASQDSSHRAITRALMVFVQEVQDSVESEHFFFAGASGRP